MKIALIGRYGEGDIVPGPERVARELYGQFKKNDFDVTFIEYFFTGYLDYSFFKKIFGKEKKENDVLRLGVLPIIFRLLKEQYDVIHFINTQRFQIIIFTIKQFLKAKFVSSFHGLFKNETKLTNLKRSFLDLWIEKMAISKSDFFIFPSKFLLDLFNKNYNLSKDKCIVIHNGVSEIFYNKRNHFETKKIYNFVYYHSFGKGLNDFLSKISPKFVSAFRIFVIGKEEKLGTFNKNIQIFFVPPMTRDLLLEFLSDKDFVIKSSVFDAFPTIAIECMTMGIIPIVSEHSGIKEIINNNINGFIYKDDDENLSSLLREIFDGKFNLDVISTNASKIYKQLNWGKISKQYLSIYKSVL